MNKYIYGFDVGGTSIKIGLFDFNSMKMIDHYEVLTPKLDHHVAIFETIHENVLACNLKNDIDMIDILGIGIDVPCPVKNGYVNSCANLKLNRIDLIKTMQQYIPKHIELMVGNDATLAALGENSSLEFPYNNAVLITLGTGVGGGIILDGKIVEGATGLGGEIGHIRVYDEEEKICGCGSKGCLEQICGTASILEYTEKLLQTQQSSLDIRHLSVKAIFDAAKQGDPVGLNTAHRVAKYLGIAASIIAITIEPDVFIIGGGISKSGQFLIELVDKYYQENARFTTGVIPFKLAKTGNQAGMIGSAILVKNKIKNN